MASPSNFDLNESALAVDSSMIGAFLQSPAQLARETLADLDGHDGRSLSVSAVCGYSDGQTQVDAQVGVGTVSTARMRHSQWMRASAAAAVLLSDGPETAGLPESTQPQLDHVDACPLPLPVVLAAAVEQTLQGHSLPLQPLPPSEPLSLVEPSQQAAMLPPSEPLSLVVPPPATHAQSTLASVAAQVEAHPPLALAPAAVNLSISGASLASQWRRVVLLPEAAAGDASLDAAAFAHGSTAADLPPGATVYYYQRRTREAAWSLPADVPADAVRTIVRVQQVSSAGAVGSARGLGEHARSAAAPAAIAAAPPPAVPRLATSFARAAAGGGADASAARSRSASGASSSVGAIAAVAAADGEAIDAAAGSSPRQLRHPEPFPLREAQPTQKQLGRAADDAAANEEPVAASAVAESAADASACTDIYGPGDEADYSAAGAAAAFGAGDAAVDASMSAPDDYLDEVYLGSSSMLDASTDAALAVANAEAGGAELDPDLERMACPLCTRRFAPARLLRHAEACAAAQSSARRRSSVGTWDSLAARLKDKPALEMSLRLAASAAASGRSGAGGHVHGAAPHGSPHSGGAATASHGSTRHQHQPQQHQQQARAPGTPSRAAPAAGAAAMGSGGKPRTPGSAGSARSRSTPTSSSRAGGIAIGSARRGRRDSGHGCGGAAVDPFNAALSATLPPLPPAPVLAQAPPSRVDRGQGHAHHHHVASEEDAAVDAPLAPPAAAPAAQAAGPSGQTHSVRRLSRSLPRGSPPSLPFAHVARRLDFAPSTTTTATAAVTAGSDEDQAGAPMQRVAAHFAAAGHAALSATMPQAAAAEPAAPIAAAPVTMFSPSMSMSMFAHMSATAAAAAAAAAAASVFNGASTSGSAGSARGDRAASGTRATAGSAAAEQQAFDLDAAVGAAVNRQLRLLHSKRKAARARAAGSAASELNSSVNTSGDTSLGSLASLLLKAGDEFARLPVAAEPAIAHASEHEEHAADVGTADADADAQAGADEDEAALIAESAPVACASCGAGFAGAAALCRHLVDCSAWRTWRSPHAQVRADAQPVQVQAEPLLLAHCDSQPEPMDASDVSLLMALDHHAASAAASPAAAAHRAAATSRIAADSQDDSGAHGDADCSRLSLEGSSELYMLPQPQAQPQLQLQTHSQLTPQRSFHRGIDGGGAVQSAAACVLGNRTGDPRSGSELASASATLAVSAADTAAASFTSHTSAGSDGGSLSMTADLLATTSGHTTSASTSHRVRTPGSSRLSVETVARAGGLSQSRLPLPKRLLGGNFDRGRGPAVRRALHFEFDAGTGGGAAAANMQLTAADFGEADLTPEQPEAEREAVEVEAEAEAPSPRALALLHDRQRRRRLLAEHAASTKTIEAAAGQELHHRDSSSSRAAQLNASVSGLGSALAALDGGAIVPEPLPKAAAATLTAAGPLPTPGSSLPCPFCGDLQRRDALWMHIGDCGLGGFASFTATPRAAAAAVAVHSGAAAPTSGGAAGLSGAGDLPHRGHAGDDVDAETDAVVRAADAFLAATAEYGNATSAAAGSNGTARHRAWPGDPSAEQHSPAQSAAQLAALERLRQHKRAAAAAAAAAAPPSASKPTAPGVRARSAGATARSHRAPAAAGAPGSAVLSPAASTASTASTSMRSPAAVMTAATGAAATTPSRVGASAQPMDVSTASLIRSRPRSRSGTATSAAARGGSVSGGNALSATGGSTGSSSSTGTTASSGRPAASASRERTGLRPKLLPAFNPRTATVATGTEAATDAVAEHSDGGDDGGARLLSKLRAVLSTVRQRMDGGSAAGGDTDADADADVDTSRVDAASASADVSAHAAAAGSRAIARQLFADSSRAAAARRTAAVSSADAAAGDADLALAADLNASAIEHSAIEHVDFEVADHHRHDASASQLKGAAAGRAALTPQRGSAGLGLVSLPSSPDAAEHQATGNRSGGSRGEVPAKPTLVGRGDDSDLLAQARALLAAAGAPSGSMGSQQHAVLSDLPLTPRSPLPLGAVRAAVARALMH